MTRLLLPLLAAIAVPAAAFAQPAKMADAQLDAVVAGWVNPGGNPCGNSPWDCQHPSNERGNNGWGNGADPSNPGSDNGLTAPSKTANGTAGPGVNTNPTNSSGR